MDGQGRCVQRGQDTEGLHTDTVVYRSQQGWSTCRRHMRSALGRADQMLRIAIHVHSVCILYILPIHVLLFLP